MRSRLMHDPLMPFYETCSYVLSSLDSCGGHAPAFLFMKERDPLNFLSCSSLFTIYTHNAAHKSQPQSFVRDIVEPNLKCDCLGRVHRIVHTDLTFTWPVHTMNTCMHSYMSHICQCGAHIVPLALTEIAHLPCSIWKIWFNHLNKKIK